MFYGKSSSCNNFLYLLLISYIQLLDFGYSKSISDIRNYGVLYGSQYQTEPYTQNHKIGETWEHKFNDFFQGWKYIGVKPEYNILYNIIYFIISRVRGILFFSIAIIFLVSERPGRPKRKYPTTAKFFHIRKDLAEKLEADAKIANALQSNIINIALERYYDFSAQSDQQLVKRKEEIERELNNINNTLFDRVKKTRHDQERKEKEDKALLELFKRFCLMLGNVADSNNIPPLTNLNKTYGVNLSAEIFQHICSEYKKGSLTIEDFKKLRQGEAI